MIKCLLLISLVIFTASVPRAFFESNRYSPTEKTSEMAISHQESPKIFPGRWLPKVNNVPEAAVEGLVVRCEEKNWRIVVKRQYFGHDVLLSPTPVQLGEDGADGECTPMKDFTTSTEMVIAARLQDCGSESRVSGNWLIYSNKLVFSSATNVTRDGGLALAHPPTVVPIECRYKRKLRVSAEPLSPTWLPMTSTIEAVGLLHFSLNVIKGDSKTVCPSTVFQQGEPLLLEAAVHGLMHRPLRIYVDRCVASVDWDPLSRPGYEFISNHGCLMDSMLPYSSSKFHSRPKQNVLWFSVQTSYFPPELRKQIFISCHLRAAPDHSLPDSRNKACYFHGPSFSWRAVEGSSRMCLCCETADCNSVKMDISSKYPDEQIRAVGPLQVLSSNMQQTGKLTIAT